MEFATCADSATRGWTAVVPWARAWNRSTGARIRASVPRTGLAQSSVADGPWKPATKDAWVDAAAALRAAREQMADWGDDPDSWPGLMARHAVHLAVGRVRSLASQLDLVEGQLAGSVTHR